MSSNYKQFCAIIYLTKRELIGVLPSVHAVEEENAVTNKMLIDFVYENQE
jgi:hypothetical protein